MYYALKENSIILHLGQEEDFIRYTDIYLYMKFYVDCVNMASWTAVEWPDGMASCPDHYCHALMVSPWSGKPSDE